MLQSIKICSLDVLELNISNDIFKQ